MQLITHDKLKTLLSEKIVHFSFLKVNGKDTREAYGTTKAEYIPSDKQAAGSSTKKKVIEFFDIEKKAWRSLSVDSNFYVINTLDA